MSGGLRILATQFLLGIDFWWKFEDAFAQVLADD